MHRWMVSTTRVVAIALMATTFAATATAGRAHKGQEGAVENVTQHGRIDWDKGMLYATGLGALSVTEPNEAKAYLRARSFAKLDALRNLLMVVDHVRIDSRTIGRDFEAVSDEIRAEVHGIVRGAQVVAERKVHMGGGTMIEVTVGTPMYGDQGIAQVFVPEIVRRNRDALEQRGVAPEPQITVPEPTTPPVELPALPEAPPIQEPQVQSVPQEHGGGAYTSVIIDARGFGIWRSMSPKVRRADGSEVWGTVTADPNYVIEHGIVAYAHSIDQARRLERAGDNPLVIRAIGRVQAPFPSDPFISAEDTDRLLAADAGSGFLGRFHVIFVVDEGR